ncbi:hypothetical protein [Acidiphilium acidophilum]|uniref:hypothetical protein n=1 Tax=Acidiphilium acidophilum TaxID=76588 RepID=UPI002E8E73D6|nr:hypothetical protein [Acidiphilium acidophilum]
MCKYNRPLRQPKTLEQLTKAAHARELRAIRRLKSLTRDAERAEIAAQERIDFLDSTFPGYRQELAEHAAELAANPPKVRNSRDCLVTDQYVSPTTKSYANSYWSRVDRMRENDPNWDAEPYFSVR